MINKVVLDTQLKNRNTGAGANANPNPKADMMQFAGSDDTLAELVWSPGTGLNIKFAEEKPCSMSEAGPSEMEFYNTENTQNEEHIDGMTNGGDGSGYESRSPLKIEPVMQCKPSKHVETDTVKMEKDGCFSDKAAEKHQVESQGSMESCRNANFLSKTKRKCSFDQQLILGSKRIKNQTRSNSFMNWISNTLKGLRNHNIHDPRVSACDETRSLGFHNVFQSLFSPETIKQFEKKSTGCFYERVTKETPKDIFDTIRKLRLSRTDILKWMNSRSSVAHLDGFFLRLRVAKWEEGAGGSKYYVACITGSKGETPREDLKQSIPVKVGDVKCLVQSRYISNCDFLEDELIAWWQKLSKNGGIPNVKDLKSKLAERTLAM
ncbi:hypothetical protein SSX86_012299 [Deinandra increscens subsp. villosa]|uniref:Plus3 domain-containing protein n=1 Tax=Deinandra increscens subsp. villosa TaxID=3103831 RepID=A0AAP0GYN0_9ASTR